MGSQGQKLFCSVTLLKAFSWIYFLPIWLNFLWPRFTWKLITDILSHNVITIFFRNAQRTLEVLLLLFHYYFHPNNIPVRQNIFPTQSEDFLALKALRTNPMFHSAEPRKTQQASRIIIFQDSHSISAAPSLPAPSTLTPQSSHTSHQPGKCSNKH